MEAKDTGGDPRKSSKEPDKPPGKGLPTLSGRGTHGCPPRAGPPVRPLPEGLGEPGSLPGAQVPPSTAA